jgi:membrane protease YdiL (CAAX protease family)
MAVYLTVPFLAFSAFRGSASRMWIEPAVILWIWLPMEFGWIRQFLITSQGADLQYAFAQLLAIDAGIVAFAVWNRTPGIGYRFEWSDAIARAAFANFAWFALIAIPLGLAIDFIHYSFHLSKLVPAPAALAGIFMFTAIPEEFLFRGLIQNCIERTTRKPGWSLVLGSLIFGASHLNNGSPKPNYRYFLLATIAGVFYGRAWRKTRRLTASATAHALVDACWSVFFR